MEKLKVRITHKLHAEVLGIWESSKELLWKVWDLVKDNWKKFNQICGFFPPFFGKNPQDCVSKGVGRGQNHKQRNS